MKNTNITINFNCWCSIAPMSLSEKITTFAEHIKNKYNDLSVITSINIQEFIGGKNAKYIQELESAFEGRFQAITPPSFQYFSHPRSIMNITLIRRGIQYRVIPFAFTLPNRTIYLEAKIGEQNFRILNYYAVQTQTLSSAASWYAVKRLIQKETLWGEVLEEATHCSKNAIPLLILGDMQESSQDIHIQQLIKQGFREKNPVYFPTAKGFQENRIDHMIYSQAAWNEPSFHPASMDFDGNLLGSITDHIMLATSTK